MNLSPTDYYLPHSEGYLYWFAIWALCVRPHISFTSRKFFLSLAYFLLSRGHNLQFNLEKGYTGHKKCKISHDEDPFASQFIAGLVLYGPPDWKWPSQTWKASSCCNPPFSICHSDSWSFAGNLYFSPLKKSLFPGVLEFHEVTWDGSFPRHYAVYLVEIKSFLHYFLPFAFSELPFRHSYSDVDLILSFLRDLFVRLLSTF